MEGTWCCTPEGRTEQSGAVGGGLGSQACVCGLKAFIALTQCAGQTAQSSGENGRSFQSGEVRSGQHRGPRALDRDEGKGGINTWLVMNSRKMQNLLLN